MRGGGLAGVDADGARSPPTDNFLRRASSAADCKAAISSNSVISAGRGGSAPDDRVRLTSAGTGLGFWDILCCRMEWNVQRSSVIEPIATRDQGDLPKERNLGDAIQAIGFKGRRNRCTNGASPSTSAIGVKSTNRLEVDPF